MFRKIGTPLEWTIVEHRQKNAVYMKIVCDKVGTQVSFSRTVHAVCLYTCVWVWAWAHCVLEVRVSTANVACDYDSLSLNVHPHR